jgi:hypothetical protein
MTYLLALLAEGYLAGFTLIRSLKALKLSSSPANIDDTDAEIEEPELEMLLMNWTLFGLLCAWDTLADTWLASLPMYYYVKAFVIFAISVPTLRINIAVFETLVHAVEGCSHYGLRLRDVPVSALELLLASPVALIEILFPFEPMLLDTSDVNSRPEILFTPLHTPKANSVPGSPRSRGSEASYLHSHSNGCNEDPDFFSSPVANHTDTDPEPSAVEPERRPSQLVRLLRMVMVGDSDLRLRDTMLNLNLHSPSANRLVRMQLRRNSETSTSAGSTPNKESFFTSPFRRQR